MRTHLFGKMDSSAEACGKFDITYSGEVLPPFLTPEEPTCTAGEVFLTSGVTHVVILSLHSGRAQLLPLTLSLECLGKTKLQFTPLDQLQLHCPGVYLSPNSSLHLKQEMFLQGF